MTKMMRDSRLLGDYNKAVQRGILIRGFFASRGGQCPLIDKAASSYHA